MKVFSLAKLIIFTFLVSAIGQNSANLSVREYRKKNENPLLSEFTKLLSIPNVASDTPNMRKNADYLVAEMQKRGLRPRLLEAAERKIPPVVYGEWMTPGATKTVIFYAHYDGQPRPYGRLGRRGTREFAGVSKGNCRLFLADSDYRRVKAMGFPLFIAKDLDGNLLRVFYDFGTHSKS